MVRRSTVLKELLRQRHWQTYSTFRRQYDQAARTVDPVLVGRWPSRGQFARWLSGDIKGLPHPDHCRVLEAMFPGLSVQQMFTYPAVPIARQPPRGDALPDDDAPFLDQARRIDAPAPDALPRPPIDRLSRLTRGDAVPHPAAQADARPPAPAEQFEPNAPRSPHTLHTLHEEMAMTTEQSARFVRAAHGGVDADVLDQLDADVRQFAVDYLTRPPLALFRPLSALRTEVFDMLERRQRPAVLPRLYGIAGRLCALLAHAGADLGHSYAAETHTRTAWLCADLAEDESLRGYVRWVQANVAFWDGDFRAAARIAHAGQEHAGGGSDLLRLASQEARAWAACGEGSEVEKALAVVAQQRGQTLPDDARPAHEVGVFRFEPGKAAYYSSEVRLALGGPANARLAVRDATEALRLFDQAPVAERSPEFDAAARLDLANAHLALSELDGAAGELRTVLTLPVENRTQPILGRMSAACDTLRSPRYIRSTLARELRDEISLFRAYPARTDLPDTPP
jgi:hypothetical protein